MLLKENKNVEKFKYFKTSKNMIPSAHSMGLASKQATDMLEIAVKSHRKNEEYVTNKLTFLQIFLSKKCSYCHTMWNFVYKLQNI